MTKRSKNKPASSIPRKLLKDGLDSVGHIARNKLEQLGGLIDELEAKSVKANQYKAVDLTNYDANHIDNSFAKQTLKSSQQLLGPRIATYGKYAKKVVPDSLMQKATDGMFAQVGKLAESWSKLDLPNEHRFEGIQGLDDQQRNALAQDIANQNRALAILGGVTGLAGLPGLLADSLWLLLVSLRTVYQLATVYDKPLTGKQGIKMAYSVLSNADLSKTQEKQAILAGLSMAKGLIDKAGFDDFGGELKSIGFDGESIEYYVEKVTEIAEQFDFGLEGSKLNWLIKFLPLTSVAVGTYYNSQLIDQVIGTAKATFGPEPKMAKEALMDDSGDSAKTDASQSDSDISNNDNASKDDTDKADASTTDDADSDKKMASDDKLDVKEKDSKKTDVEKADAKEVDATKADANHNSSDETKGADLKTDSESASKD